MSFIRSIRARLTLWYVFVLAIVLIIFCIVLFASIRYRLNHQINSALLRQADSISDSFHADSEKFLDLPDKDYIPNPLVWFRLVRIDGSLFRPAPSFGIFHYPFPFDRAKKMAPDAAFFDTFQLADGKKFRTVIFPVDEGKERVGWVQIVRPIGDIHRTLNLIKRYMFFLVPLSLLILAIGGNFLAKKSLQPVEEIRRQVDRIYEKNLSQRIHAVNPDDELGQLTTTFNRMLERLQTAFESQRHFLADASHELKTPLAVLRGQWEHLFEHPDFPAEFKSHLRNDIEELARLSKLIDNLLLLSAVDDNKIKIEQQPVNLSLVLKEVYEDGKILAESKKQKIHLKISDDSAEINGDKNRLVQLFLNLVDNAIKYTPPKGEIFLSLSRKDDKILVEIQDTGIGIPKKDLPFIFNRFYRVDKSRSRELGGSGLGLSICQWIVQAHSGEISIDSKIGEGMRVSISFKV